MLHIGEKLFQIRKRYGMTQLEVATAADISEKTYARMERGPLNVRADTPVSYTHLTLPTMAVV